MSPTLTKDTQAKNEGQHIAFVLPDGFALGGVTNWSLEMCRRLTQSGRSARLIKHPNYYNPPAEIDLPSSIQFIDCEGGLHPNHPFLTDHHIPHYLASYRQTLPGVIIPNWSFGAYAACAAIAADEPAALRVIGFAHTDEADYYEWLTYYESIIHLFVAVSQEIAQTLTNLMPHRQSDIIVRPYAVNALPSLHREYSPSREPLQLIYAGRIAERQKRVSDLLHLVKALVKERVNFQLRIVGSGVDEQAFRRKIHSLAPKYRSRVSLVGSLPSERMPEAWRAADIFVLTSEYEGASIAMLEAMAHGCVPVVTEVSGTTAVIEPGRNGFWVPVGGVAEMARIIQQLEADRARLAEIGIAAYRTILHGFSYNEYTDWFRQTAESLWVLPPRAWPFGRPLVPSEELRKIKLTDLSRVVHGDRQALKTVLAKISARPGLRWLYRYRNRARRILG